MLSSEDIKLEPITKKNFGEILELKVRDEQKDYVADNYKSFCQSYFDKGSWLRGVYLKDTAVGLVLVRTEEENFEDLKCAGQPSLWRLMVDEKFQNRNIGKIIMDKVISEVRTWPGAKVFYLSVLPGDQSAYGFYKKIGFEDIDKMIGNEKIMTLAL